MSENIHPHGMNGAENLDAPMVGVSIWRDLAVAFRRNRMAKVGLGIVVALIFIAAFAPLICPYDPYKIDLANKTIAPSAAHWLGTDELGRDLLTRLFYGARISLLIGVVPAIIAQIIGTAVGIVAGYYGGKIDYALMRVADVVIAFPSLLLAMAIMYTLEGGLVNLFIALSFIGWARSARVVRSLALSIREKEFVAAARSIGVRDGVIMLRHVLPNCIPTLVVLLTLSVPEFILQEASLSFLGMGAMPPTPSWGLIAIKGKEFLFSAPWVSVMPGLFILTTVLGFNFLGDGVRDALDPTLRQ